MVFYIGCSKNIIFNMVMYIGCSKIIMFYMVLYIGCSKKHNFLYCFLYRMFKKHYFCIWFCISAYRGPIGALSGQQIRENGTKRLKCKPCTLIFLCRFYECAAANSRKRLKKVKMQNLHLIFLCHCLEFAAAKSKMQGLHFNLFVPFLRICCSKFEKTGQKR